MSALSNDLGVRFCEIEIVAIPEPLAGPFIDPPRELETHGGQALIDGFAVLGQRHDQARADEIDIPGRVIAITHHNGSLFVAHHAVISFDEAQSFTLKDFVEIFPGKLPTIVLNYRRTGEAVTDAFPAVYQFSDLDMGQQVGNLCRVDVAPPWHGTRTAFAPPVSVGGGKDRIGVKIVMQGCTLDNQRRKE